MREIKFRAWDIKNKKMCQVIKMYYVPDVGANEVLIQHPDSFDELLLGVDTQAVLLQYTGLRDKNGKEIYEGDIYKFEDTVGGPITFNTQTLCWLWAEDGGFLWALRKDAEVIGNIYENKELLV
jgi:uncharacterized phage protein (TIGR01671 family)